MTARSRLDQGGMTREQQKRLNAMCGDLAEQVLWSVRMGGADYPTRLHRDDWRHMWAGIVLGDRVAPNPENPERFITLAASSRMLTKKEAGDVMEMIAAFGSARGVVFSDPQTASYEAAA